MDEVTTAFAHRYWDAKAETFFQNRFMGVICLQHPFDVQATEEIIWETRPELIVECGTFGGGSTLRWAAAMESYGIDGIVACMDIADHTEAARAHPLWDRRVQFREVSSVDGGAVAWVTELALTRRTMVILDSDHAADHVLTEMDAYGPLVTPGCYMIVQDGFVSSLDPEHGPGPLEAIDTYLAEGQPFEVDRSRERQLFTFNPSGFLKRL